MHYVAEHLVARPSIGPNLFSYDACDHRHTTKSGAKRCAERQIVEPGQAYWTVGIRQPQGGNPPLRIQPKPDDPPTLTGHVWHALDAHPATKGIEIINTRDLFDALRAFEKALG